MRPPREPQSGLIARTRRLFCWAALVSLALTLPGAVVGADPGALAGIGLAAAALVAVWIHRLRAGRASWASDAVEVVAAGTFAACAAAPELAFGFVFTSLWPRALYSGWARGTVHAAMVVLALLAALLLWPVVPGHSGTDHAALLGPLPLTFLLSAVARHLAGNLFAREQAGARQAALAGLSSDLLTAGDHDQIVAAAWRATALICAATPGAHVLGVEEREGRLAVHASTGPWLPPLAWPGFARHAERADPVPLDGAVLAELRRTFGRAPSWVGLALPAPTGRRPRWLLVGERGPGEVTTAVHAVSQQATLALRARESHDELVRAAHTDALTGLLRRTAFTDAVRDSLPSSPALLFCDLDGFKPVNDTFGHAVGDELLRGVGERLQRVTRPGDVCARLGGDEFAVLLLGSEGLTHEIATRVARRLLTELAEPFTIEGHEIVVGASVGIAVARPGDEPDELLRHADQAMYAVKTGGKSGFSTYAR